MLISEEYKAQVTEKHRENAGWGTTGKNFALIVQRLIGDWAPLNVLDYGCGKQTLAQALPQYRIKGYDPAIPGLEDAPVPHDFVVCTDVLEHIEPDCLDDVLDDLQRVTRKNLFVEVSTQKAIQKLPDGRNAHLIVEPCRWWLNKLWDRFELISMSTAGTNFQALFGALNPKGNGTK